MNYILPVIPAIPNPVNLDAAILRLQKALGALPWLEYVYGRASVGITLRDGKPYRVPEVYAGEGNYLTLEPNNYLSAHAFFKLEGPQEAPEYVPNVKNRYTQQVSIIIWLNLERVKERLPVITLEHRFTEEIKADILDAIRREGTFTLKRIYESPEQVYAGYSIDHIENQTFKHPEAGFRLEGELTYLEDCMPRTYDNTGGRIIVNGGFLKY